MYSVHKSCIAYMTGHMSTVHSLSFHNSLYFICRCSSLTNKLFIIVHHSFYFVCSLLICCQSICLFATFLIVYLFMIHSFSIDHSLTFVHLLFIICLAFVRSTSIHWPFIVIHHISLDVSHKCVSDTGVRPHPTNCIRNIFSPVRADS